MNIKSPEEYIRYLKYFDKDGKEFQLFLNLLTINETYFFRDYQQIQSFADHCLKEVVERKMKTMNRNLRIWSAGCSSGEEPYTLSIILSEILDDVKKWDISIYANDVDDNILKKAIAGKYDNRSIKEIPEEYLNKYFHFNGQDYSIKESIKKHVKIEHLNLNNKEQIRKHSGFDFIFCRNVLIYFDDVSRKQVVDHFWSALNKGGYIFLGSSESLGRISAVFKLKKMGQTLVYYKE